MSTKLCCFLSSKRGVSIPVTPLGAPLCCFITILFKAVSRLEHQSGFQYEIAAASLVSFCTLICLLVGWRRCLNLNSNARFERKKQKNAARIDLIARLARRIQRESNSITRVGRRAPLPVGRHVARIWKRGGLF